MTFRDRFKGHVVTLRSVGSGGIEEAFDPLEPLLRAERATARASEFEGALRDLVGSFRQCDLHKCMGVATMARGDDALRCDSHDEPGCHDLPAADALRRAVALLSGRAPKGGVP